MADALRPPRDPRVVGSRRLCRPGHAPPAPCGGAAASACRRGSGRRAVPGPGRGAGREPRSGAGHPAGCRSRPEPVRGRGSDRCPACRAVHLDRTSGCVRDRERQQPRAGDGRLRPSRVGRVPAQHGRARPGAESRQQSPRVSGRQPGLGTPSGKRRERRAQARTGACVQRRGAVGRLRRASAWPAAISHRLGRVAPAPPASPDVRAPVVDPSRLPGAHAPRAANASPAARGGTAAVSERRGARFGRRPSRRPRASVSAGSVARSVPPWAALAASGVGHDGSRRTLAWIAAALVLLVGIDRGRSVAAGAPP